MIRFFDFLFSLLGLIILSPLLILLGIIIFFENGSPLFKQYRVGYNQKLFLLIKFRTLPINTKFAATHLVSNLSITKLGFFLRHTKFDEFPQLLNVLLGHMSLVGPRPCLPTQRTLIIERKKRGIFKVRPGMTGLAQLCSIDMSTPKFLAKTELKMIKKMNVYYYFYYILKTFFLVLKK